MLPALIFALDWFVKDEIVEKLDNVVFSNDDLDHDNKDFDIFTFFTEDMDLDAMYLSKILTFTMIVLMKIFLKL